LGDDCNLGVVKILLANCNFWTIACVMALTPKINCFVYAGRLQAVFVAKHFLRFPAKRKIADVKAHFFFRKLLNPPCSPFR
jgi:hypothetical protein